MKNRGIQIGIWLDQSEAFIIRFEHGELIGQSNLPSEIEHYNLKGGSRSKVPYGPMDKTSESKKLARQVMQEKSYFKNLLESVGDAHEIYLFGPAQTKDRFREFLYESPIFKGVVRKAEPAEKMTENQRVAKARAFFVSLSAA